jgi:hypothetical protein
MSIGLKGERSPECTKTVLSTPMPSAKRMARKTRTSLLAIDEDEESSTSSTIGGHRRSLAYAKHTPALNLLKIPRLVTSEVDVLDTVRAVRDARAAKLQPLGEQLARDKSLRALMSLPMDERMRLYKRVHAAKKIITTRLNASLSNESKSTTRPQTPRDIENHVQLLGPKILSEVLEAERKNEALVASIHSKNKARTLGFLGEIRPVK